VVKEHRAVYTTYKKGGTMDIRRGIKKVILRT